ncbi:MAG: M24 family metallopeptidase [Candidatus ainarchaeum sp.]|nr:M24 family metallopeptidase [Candidatus ainarchaeum sp.]
MRLLLHRGNSFDPNFYYHSGLDIDHSFLLVDGKRTLFVPKMNEALARASFRGKVVAFENAMDTLSGYIRGRRLLFDANSLKARAYVQLARKCRLKDHSLELLRMRSVKKPEEVSAIARAARHTKEIFHSLDFRKAKTELGVRKQLLVATAELGLEPAFDPIVSSCGNSAFPHHEPSGRKLGPLVLVDYGVMYRHYRSDLTRCFILDGDRKMKSQYETLQGVCHGIIDELPNLRRGKNVAAFAAKAMERAGFPKMIHSIGHGVGLEIHEFPRLSLKSDDPIAGATMAIEPAFYLKRYGMRYEETIYFDGKKSRIF